MARTAAKRHTKPRPKRPQVAFRYAAVPLVNGGGGVYDYDRGGIALVKTGLFAKRSAQAQAATWNAEATEGTA
jgi:hypothetical protein